MSYIEPPTVMACAASFTGFVELPLQPTRSAVVPHEQQKSRLTASLQQCSRQQPAQDAPAAELRAILQAAVQAAHHWEPSQRMRSQVNVYLDASPHLQNTADGSPTTTFLGVSPPVRGGCCGGAANPLAKEAAPWRLASHQNLQALRELDTDWSFLSAHLLCGSPHSLASNDSGWCERAAQMALHKSQAKSIASAACRPQSWQQLQLQLAQHQQA
ncbi:hypothetical protein QJQ45_029944 [Haematococcus lacustris]|nr:hypothetical protein QJQ45_029944 [Haematococcus lacustris]